MTPRERIRNGGGGDYLTVNQLIEAESVDADDRLQLIRDSLAYLDEPHSGPRESVRSLMREAGLL
jgi:hypothetical protein